MHILLGTGDSYKLGWKPPPSGPLHQGEMQMFWPCSDCYSISPGVKGSVLTQYLSAPRLELAMDNFVGEVTFQATPVVPDTHEVERSGGEAQSVLGLPSSSPASSARSQADAKHRTCQECLMQVGPLPRLFIIPSPCQSVCSHHFYSRPQVP